MSDTVYFVLGVLFAVSILFTLYHLLKRQNLLSERLDGIERELRNNFRTHQDKHWELRRRVDDLAEYLEVEHVRYSGTKYEKKVLK